MVLVGCGCGPGEVWWWWWGGGEGALVTRCWVLRRDIYLQRYPVTLPAPPLLSPATTPDPACHKRRSSQTQKGNDIVPMGGRHGGQQPKAMLGSFSLIRFASSSLGS